MTKRSSGVLMHITSLPGEFGIGTFGKSAYDFVDFLEETKQTYCNIYVYVVEENKKNYINVIDKMKVFYYNNYC